jgi:hypothetical protein
MQNMLISEPMKNSGWVQSIHFILKCPLYGDLRKKYIKEILLHKTQCFQTC